MEDEIIPPVSDFARSGEKASEVEEIKDRLRKKFADMAEPMNYVEYSRENYDKLFPNSKISTPLGEVSLGGHQFEKLGNNERKHLLGSMYQVLTDPIVVINEDRDGEKAKVFSKSFENDSSKKMKTVVSVVPNIRGTNVSISTHEKDLNNVLCKIKKVADVVYEKPDNDRTAGDTANIDNIQLPNNLPHSPPYCQ
ncbi:MAG: hypothetical protein LBQ82_09070 [Treponema sp.]|jgi:hypothetical protein|nr:hypothetical protein [Treponema sp.]